MCRKGAFGHWVCVHRAGLMTAGRPTALHALLLARASASVSSNQSVLFQEPQRSISGGSSWEADSRNRSTAQHSGGIEPREGHLPWIPPNVVLCTLPSPTTRLQAVFKLSLAAARAIRTTFPTVSLSPPLGTELPCPHGEIPFSPCWDFAGKHNQHSVVGVRRASSPAMLHAVPLSCGLPHCCHPERNTNAGNETQTLC